MALGRFRKRTFRRHRAIKRKGSKKPKKSPLGGLTTSQLAKLKPGERAVVLPSLNTLLKDTLRAQFAWSCFDYINGVSVVDGHTFRLSSIYDPHYTFSTGGKNTSVRGMSIVADCYQQYKVLAVQVVLKAWNTSNNDLLLAISTSTDATPANMSNIDLVQRQENCKSLMLQRVACGSEKSQTEMKFWIPLHMVQGLTKSQYLADGNSFSAVNSNPPANSFLHIQVWNAHTGGFADPTVTADANVAQFGDSSTAVTSGEAGLGYSMQYRFYTQMRKKVLGIDL